MTAVVREWVWQGAWAKTEFRDSQAHFLQTHQALRGGGARRCLPQGSTPTIRGALTSSPRCRKSWTRCVPAAHWWLSGNVKLGLIWGSVVHCDVFVLVCCAFCMLGNVHLMFLEVLDTHLVKVQGGGYFFWRRLS